MREFVRYKYTIPSAKNRERYCCRRGWVSHICCLFHRVANSLTYTYLWLQSHPLLHVSWIRTHCARKGKHTTRQRWTSNLLIVLVQTDIHIYSSTNVRWKRKRQVTGFTVVAVNGSLLGQNFSIKDAPYLFFKSFIHLPRVGKEKFWAFSWKITHINLANMVSNYIKIYSVRFVCWFVRCAWRKEYWVIFERKTKHFGSVPKYSFHVLDYREYHHKRIPRNYIKCNLC